MRTERLITTTGETIETLVPENEDDIRTLRRMQREGVLDDRLSFADDRQPEEGEELER